jgi:hypothetical protein
MYLERQETSINPFLEAITNLSPTAPSKEIQNITLRKTSLLSDYISPFK